MVAYHARMQRLDQRILLAATLFFGALTVVNRDLLSGILAVACLAAWLLVTYRLTPR